MRGQRERRGGREREEGSAPQNDHIEEEKKDPGAERGPLAAAPHKEQQRKGLQDMRKRIPQGEPRSKVSYMQEGERSRSDKDEERTSLVTNSKRKSFYFYLRHVAYPKWSVFHVCGVGDCPTFASLPLSPPLSFSLTRTHLLGNELTSKGAKLDRPPLEK